MLISTKTQTQNIKTMSSREIAELCKKRHDNVMRTVRDLISAQILTPQIEESNFEHQGNFYKQFLLNKRDSMVVVARLSPEFMAAVVDRWQELEAQASKPVDPMAALSDPNMLREMTPCVSDSATRVEQESLARTLAFRELNKPTFDSFKECVDCGVEIPLARRQFSKGITRCVDCQEIIEIKRGKH